MHFKKVIFIYDVSEIQADISMMLDRELPPDLRWRKKAILEGWFSLILSRTNLFFLTEPNWDGVLPTKLLQLLYLKMQEYEGDVYRAIRLPWEFQQIDGAVSLRNGDLLLSFRTARTVKPEWS